MWASLYATNIYCRNIFATFGGEDLFEDRSPLQSLSQSALAKHENIKFLPWRGNRLRRAAPTETV